MTTRLFFSVGEPSGDHHAARLIRCLRERGHKIGERGQGIGIADSGNVTGGVGRPVTPDYSFTGFGGPKMAAAGVPLLTDLTRHAVVGILEVVPKIRQFYAFADQAEACFARGEVDAVVLVDFPGFNWHIARRARRYGIPVLYYCPPQLWAWGGWRMRKLRRTVDHVLSVLPFENDFYRDRGVSCEFVGHPFFDDLAESDLDAATMARFRSDDSPRVAILPGSRTGEVEANFPVQLAAAARLHDRHPKLRFSVACHRDPLALRCREQIERFNRGRTVPVPMDVYVNRTAEIITASDAAMMVSGSVSLELMARRTPAAVMYRVSRSLNFIGRRLVNVSSITLPNLIAGRQIFPEMVSAGDPEPAIEFLCESIDRMLTDRFYRQNLQRDLDELASQYATAGATEAAADAVVRWLAGHIQSDSGDFSTTVAPDVSHDPVSTNQTIGNRAA